MSFYHKYLFTFLAMLAIAADHIHPNSFGLVYSHQLSADQKLITNDQQSIKNDQLQMVSGKLLFWLRFIEKWRRINEKWLKCLIDKPNFIDQLHKSAEIN